MTDEAALHEEQHRIRRMRLLVDVTAQVLSEDEKLTFCEALRLIEAARTAVLRLFPDKDDTFNLVIRPRPRAPSPRWTFTRRSSERWSSAGPSTAS